LDASITTRLSQRAVVITAVVDVVAVVVFVAIGRRNHDEGTALSGVLSVATPFLIALLASWVGLRTWNEPFTRRSWAATWAITVIVGLLLRRLVFDRGIATPFIIVATITLGVLLALGRLLSRKLTAKTSQ
jgi:hydrogenase/urease accessory protein HupE